MRRKILLLILTLSITFSVGNVPAKAGLPGNISGTFRYPKTINMLPAHKAVIDDDKVIAKVDGEATDKQIKKAFKGVAKSYKKISGKFKIDKNLPKEKKERLQKYLDKGDYTTIMEVDLKDGVEPAEAESKLESKKIVDYVEYNYKNANVESYGVNDTYSASQYHLPEIGAKTAWNTYERSGYKETWVAVLDTGLYTANKEFNGMYLKEYSVDVTSSEYGEQQKAVGSSLTDKDGHGTHVAGIIAARGNNAFSTAGVASGWINDCCKIMPIKIMDDEGYCRRIDLIKGIQYAIEHGAEVINISLSEDEYSSHMQEVIDNAYKAGITVVAAKGNNSQNRLRYPADNNHVISVSATDEYNKLADFSNYGKVDIAAPGNNIVSSSCSTVNKYTLMSGTSMSTPMVSATAALIRGINYDLSVDQVEKLIYETATKIGDSTYFGAGLVNTGYAVQKAKYLGLRSENITLKSVTKTSAGNAKIKWSELYNAEGYCVYRATSTDGKYTRIAVVDDLSYVDKSVKKGKKYYYKVRGYMYYGHGSGTVNGKKVGYSTYSGVKSIKIK